MLFILQVSILSEQIFFYLFSFIYHNHLHSLKLFIIPNYFSISYDNSHFTYSYVIVF